MQNKSKSRKSLFQDEIDQEAKSSFALPPGNQSARNLAILQKMAGSRVRKLRIEGEADQPAPSTVKPKSVSVNNSNWKSFLKESGGKREKNYLGIDCEMVLCQVEGEQIHQLARLSLVNQKLVTVFDSFIKPTRKITNYLTWVSGVTPAKLSKAPTFAQVSQKVKKVIEGHVLVGHTIQNDLRVLPGIHAKCIDIRDFSLYKIGESKFVSLRKLCMQHLGVTIQESAHNSAEDARTTMQLFLKHKAAILQQLSK